MKIQGLQKLTLLDFPERVACTVFFAGCNFRCPFCHNASLVVDIPSQADVTEEEVDFVLEKLPAIVQRLRDMSPVWEDFLKSEKA